MNRFKLNQVFLVAAILTLIVFSMPLSAQEREVSTSRTVYTEPVKINNEHKLLGAPNLPASVVQENPNTTCNDCELKAMKAGNAHINKIKPAGSKTQDTKDSDSLK